MWQEQRDALDRGRTNEQKYEQRKRWMGEEQRKALENKNKKCWMGADITHKKTLKHQKKCWMGKA